MNLINRVAEVTGYAVYVIAVLGVAGTAAATVSDLIRRDQQDPYPQYAARRDLELPPTPWDQHQEAVRAGAPAPLESDPWAGPAGQDTPGGTR
jgi:hypothetical protein